jgi:release factor glutamine methyltransferase
LIPHLFPASFQFQANPSRPVTQLQKMPAMSTPPQATSVAPLDAVEVTLATALNAATASGLARLDAQLLLLFALGQAQSSRAWLLAHDQTALNASAKAVFSALVSRRLAGEPVAYLTGHKAFYGLDLQVDARVLVPRPDTETLVDWALALLPEPQSGSDFEPDFEADSAAQAAKLPGLLVRKSFESRAFSLAKPAAEPSVRVGSGGDVLDLGTGSGAVALAIKHSRPHLRVTATDFSPEALQVAQINAKRLNLSVEFRQGAWLQAVQGRFALIVANPPYIADDDAHLAALAHEPLQALASGPDGLSDIRAIIRQAPGHLQQGGWLLLEHGFDQAAAVRNLLREGGFDAVESRCDLSGTERCSGGQMLPPRLDIG